jgi:hypothetical protein
LLHVFVQMVCALVKPTIMARKMVRASRGTDPKRPAEPRRAESRHDREAARAHIVSGERKGAAKAEETERKKPRCDFCRRPFRIWYRTRTTAFWYVEHLELELTQHVAPNPQYGCYVWSAQAHL